MNRKNEIQDVESDKLKWVIVGSIVSAGIIANFYFSAQPLALRLIGWLILAGIVVVVALQTSKGQETKSFFYEAYGEMRRVSWPGRQETIQSTLLVMMMVVVTALLLWVVDSTLLWLVSLLTGQRG